MAVAFIFVRRIRQIIPLFIFVAAGVLVCAGAEGKELKYHGPIIQWHRDPATSATFTWIERVAPDLPTLPVWREGRSGFGYGDGDDTTELLDMEGNYTRVYIAKGFALESIPEGAELKLVIYYDDAFVAWINGKEVARSANIKSHHAEAKITGLHSGRKAEEFVIGDAGSLLKAGRNLISVEGHNIRGSSSDMTLHPILMLGDEVLVAEEDEWAYLAGADPQASWYLKEPSLSPVPVFPRGDVGEWSLGIRGRGAVDAFTWIDIEEHEFADTGNAVFKALIEGLEADRPYEFLLAVDERPVETGWFRTAPRELTKPMQFVVGGDMGTAIAVPVSLRAGREDPLFAVVGGDLAYANGRDAWRWYDWIDNWTDLVISPEGRWIPMIMGIGNHEMKGIWGKKSNAPFYFSLFDLPTGDSNFTVDFSDYLSIVLLDSDHAQDVQDQTDWLAEQLEARRGVPNLMVVYHRPAWGTGVKGNMKSIQREWCPLFEKYEVDCVFENDHHVYKRTHPLTKGRRDDEKGILYLGDGAWGAKVREITPKDLKRVGADEYLAHWKSINHLIKVTIHPDGTRHYEAMDAEGTIIDETLDERDRTE